jgi:hypothetical protein
MGPGHLKILKEPPVLEVIVVPFLWQIFDILWKKEERESQQDVQRMFFFEKNGQNSSDLKRNFLNYHCFAICSNK